MQRLLTALAALGSGLLLAVACTDKAGDLFPDPDAGALGGRRAVGGSGGSRAGVGGAGGSAGTAGNAAGSAGSGGQDAGTSLPGCQSALDCDDQNACSIESCEGGVCVAAGFAVLGAPCGSASANECKLADQCDGNGQCSPNHLAAGTPCGDLREGECVHPDVCGNGVCLPNDAANGSACTDGSCTEGTCVAGQPVGCPVEVARSVPFNTSWSSVGRPNLYGGSCDSGGTPDYALVFTAPQAGTFRFTAHALVDSTPYTGADSSADPTQPPDGDAVITVADGNCAGQGATPIDCDDDGGDGIDSQLDLPLNGQQTVTVYLNERTQTGGGTGTLSITLLP
jgi:hypothetical protein